VLKLAKSGSDGEKVFLLLESGTRFHTVQVHINLLAIMTSVVCSSKTALILSQQQYWHEATAVTRLVERYPGPIPGAWRSSCNCISKKAVTPTVACR
jgi:hypothetical protein